MELLLKVKKSYGTIHKRRRQFFWIFETPLPHVGSSLVHSVRGQSGFFNLALTEGNMQIEFDLKLSVYSLGVDI